MSYDNAGRVTGVVTPRGNAAGADPDQFRWQYESLARPGHDNLRCSREGRTPYLWSRRDAIASAAANGELSLEDYARFLKLMGEKVICPDS